jgi:hypothetical protein
MNRKTSDTGCVPRPGNKIHIQLDKEDRCNRFIQGQTDERYAATRDNRQAKKESCDEACP